MLDSATTRASVVIALKLKEVFGLTDINDLLYFIYKLSVLV